MAGAFQALMAGTAASATPVQYRSFGGTNFPSTSVTIPTHQVGDLIVLYAGLASATPAVPAAGGTVPTWIVANNQVTNVRIVYAVATATNHTSGTWNTTTRFAVVVLSGQNSVSPIGATNATQETTANSDSSPGPTAPAVTLQNNTGTSALIHFAHTGAAQSNGWTTSFSESGYTLRHSTTVTTNVRCVTKDTTASDGALAMGATVGAAGWAAATLEILA